MKYYLTLLIWAFYSTTWAAEEAPQALNLDGRLFTGTSSSTPLLDSGILKIQILDYGGTCVLYEEEQPFDTRATNGAFNINVGEKSSGTTKRTSGDVGNTLAAVFANTGGTIPGKLLSNGSACTGAATVGYTRSIRIVVIPDSDPTPRAMTPFAVSSVPSALVAETLQGVGPSGFLQTRATAPYSLSQANLENVFTTVNYVKLTDLLAGTSSFYTHAGANGTIQAPSISGTPSSPTAGQIWYDSGVLKYWDGSASQALSAGSGVTSLIAGSGLTGGTISTGGQTIAVDTGVTVGKIVAVQTGGKLPALDGSDLTNVTASAFSSTGSISTTGSVSANSANFRSLTLTNAGTQTITLNPAGTITGSPLSFTLPAAMPASNGYVLSSTTAGVMSWVPQSSGGLAAVSNSASLANGKIWIGDAGGLAQEQTVSGDATLAAGGGVSVTGIRGIAVSSTAPGTAGQVLRYSGSQWAPAFVSMFDLRSTVTGAQAFGGVGCLSNQTLTWTSATDDLACSNISLPAGQVTGTLAVANGGTGVTSLPGTFVLNGGQDGAVIAGTNDATSLTFETNNSPRVTIDSAGNVGIGTTTPITPLDVNGGTISQTNPTIDSTLSAGMTASDTSLTLADASTYPNAGVLFLNGAGAPEYVAYSGKSGNALTGLTRGLYGTTAQVQTSGKTARFVRFASVRPGTVPSGFAVFGNGAVAIGLAEGNYQPGVNSLTVGHNSRADAAYSAVIGMGARTLGTHSLAVGNGVTANGVQSQAFGNFTTATNFGSMVLGQYNVGVGATTGSWETAESVFEIGIGASAVSKANAMTVLKDGKVGIGTTTPGYLLDVNGSVNATAYYLNGVAFTGSGSTSTAVAATGGAVSSITQTATNAASAARTSLLLQNNGTGGANEYNIIGKDAAGTTNFVVTQSGNVGIGTASPTAKLAVNETSASTGPVVSVLKAFNPSSALQSTTGIDASVWTPSTNSTNIGTITGLSASAWPEGSGTVSQVVGGAFDALTGNTGITVTTLQGIKVFASAEYDGNNLSKLNGGDFYVGQNGSTGTVTDMNGLYLNSDVGANVTNFSGLKIDTGSVTGTITNRYGIYMAAPAGTATNDYGIYQQGTQQNYFAGNVGIGTTTPVAKLDVAGQIRAQVYNAGSSTSINWNNGNTQYTSAACNGTGNQFSFSNMLEGGTYTLIVTGTATGSCNFTCAGTSCASGTYTTTTPSGVTAWTFMPSNNTPTGSYTVYTMVRAGGIVFVSWITGFGPGS